MTAKKKPLGATKVTKVVSQMSGPLSSLVSYVSLYYAVKKDRAVSP